MERAEGIVVVVGKRHVFFDKAWSVRFGRGGWVVVVD